MGNGSERDVRPPLFSAQQQKLQDALNHMEVALQLLDEADCSPDVGAHLDLALCRLKDVLPQPGPDVIPPQSEPPAAWTE